MDAIDDIVIRRCWRLLQSVWEEGARNGDGVPRIRPRRQNTYAKMKAYISPRQD